MHRKIRNITLLLTGLIFFVACDDENPKGSYNSETGNHVSFRNDKLNKSLEKTEDLLSIPVYRENPSGRAVLGVKLLFEYKQNGSETPGREFFSLESDSLIFSDGETSALVKLKIDLTKLDYLTRIKTQVRLTALENASFSHFTKSSILVSLTRKPSWILMKGKGKYISRFLGIEKEVDVLKAEEAPFYIIKNCYVDNADIRIDLDAENKASVELQRAFIHKEYGIGYLKGSGKLDSMQNAIVLDLQFLVQQEGQWMLLSGLSFQEILKLPSE